MDQIKSLNKVRINLDDIIIRSWVKGDEQSLVDNANNPKIWLNVRDRFPHPYTLKDAALWVRIAASDKSMLNLAIEHEGKAVGAIGVIFKNDVHRHTAEIGYWLGEKYWGKGIMTRAVRALTDYVFQHYDICRIYAGIFEYNQASARVLEKAGYHLEATLKKNVTKCGKTVNELIYVRLLEDAG